MIVQRPSPATSSAARDAKAQRRHRRWLKPLTVLNALCVLTLFVLIGFVSERWWVSAALSFAPRLPFAAPSVILLGLTLWLLPRWSIVNGVSTIVSLVFIPGLCAPVDRDRRPEDDSRVIRFLTCNVQACSSDAEKLIEEFESVNPDVVVMQEYGHCDLIDAYFLGWNTERRGEYRIVSRYPVRQIGELRTPTVFGKSGRLTAVVFEVDHPSGKFQVADIHCHTARWGLMELQNDSLFTGDGVEAFKMFQELREIELNSLAEYCEMLADRGPTLFAGDFNTPSSSSMFAEFRAEYRSAYESAGWGYGYTSPCNTAGRWPGNTPWLRIDHILMSQEWAVHSAAIGRSNGSDHRLMWAEVSLREEGE